MRERVTNRIEAAPTGLVAESRPRRREFPEELLFLVVLSALACSAAAGTHALDRKIEGLGWSHARVARYR
jgi:hypothetical protein